MFVLTPGGRICLCRYLEVVVDVCVDTWRLYMFVYTDLNLKHFGGGRIGRGVCVCRKCQKPKCWGHHRQFHDINI